MKNASLIKRVKVYCGSVLNSGRCNDLPFHNWAHTKAVVKDSSFIAEQEKLPQQELEELIIAAYFHDMGHAERSSGHEKISCTSARSFLKEENYPSAKIENVASIIMATKMPQHPVTQQQKIICDADLAHLGKCDFMMKNLNLRKEWAQFNNAVFSDEEWLKMNIDFLGKHTFHTDSAKRNFNHQKSKNLDLLKLQKSLSNPTGKG